MAHRAPPKNIFMRARAQIEPEIYGANRRRSMENLIGTVAAEAQMAGVKVSNEGSTYFFEIADRCAEVSLDASGVFWVKSNGLDKLVYELVYDPQSNRIEHTDDGIEAVDFLARAIANALVADISE